MSNEDTKRREATAARIERMKEIRPALPELEGTEKQAKWARDIRWDGLHAALENVEYRKSLFDNQPADKREVAHKAYDRAFKKLTIQANAKWWIDNRTNLNGKVEAWAVEYIKQATQ